MDKFINVNLNSEEEKMNAYFSINEINYSYKKPKFPYNIIKIEKDLNYKNIYEKYIKKDIKQKKSRGGYDEQEDTVHIFLF